MACLLLTCPLNRGKPTYLDRMLGGPTGIPNEGIRRLTGVELDPLQHGQQLHRIAGLVAEADGHDHLMANVQHGLSVVALDPAITAF